MIALLKGTVESKDTSYIIIDVAGVGYKVGVSNALMSKLSTADTIKMYIHTHVKDDAIDLYGFLDLLDLKLFEQLIGVSGIGPKTVLGIFSTGSRSDIINAIIKGDVSFFTAVPRLGKKNAQKIIIELKGKLGSTADLDLSGSEGGNEDVIVALQGFGFSLREAQMALRSIDETIKTPEEKIKKALKYLGK